MRNTAILELRLREQNRIYDASPGVTATFKDLARVNEDMLEMMALFNATKAKIGFRSETEQGNNAAISEAASGSTVSGS